MWQNDVEVIEKCLSGAVIDVLDKDWGFWAGGRVQHPGACLFYFPGEKFVTLVRGVDRNSKIALEFESYRDVFPDETNGLDKPTRFELVPHRKKTKKVELWAIDRMRGTLSDSDLKRMREELQRIFPGNGGGTN